jgi:hypothetical protein
MTASGRPSTIHSVETRSASIVGVVSDIVGVVLPGLLIVPGAAAV